MSNHEFLQCADQCNDDLADRRGVPTEDFPGALQTPISGLPEIGAKMRASWVK
jgi:hypothetical protein